MEWRVKARVFRMLIRFAECGEADGCGVDGVCA